MKNKIKIWALLPIIAFAAMGFLIFKVVQEEKDPSLIPSVLISKPIADFELAQLGDFPIFSSKDFISEDYRDPIVLNFWASWCVACRAEHYELKRLSEAGIKIYGLASKDEPANSLEFLQKYGNVYDKLGSDQSGRRAIDFGVYGMPETFIIDHKGIIRYKQIGPITKGLVYEQFVEQYEKVKQASKGGK